MGWDGPQQGLEQYLKHGAENCVEGVTRVLEGLYKETAGQAQAGPLAFYSLAMVAERHGEITNRFSPDLQGYFQRLRNRDQVESRAFSMPSARRHGKAIGEDRVLRFLDRINAPPNEAIEIQPYIWSPRELMRFDRKRTLDKIRIVIIGGPKSGKTSFIRELVLACRRRDAALGLTFDDSVDTNKIGPDGVSGKFMLEGKERGLRIVEAGSLKDSMRRRDTWPEDSESPPRWGAGDLADLLVIAIEPSHIDRREPPPGLPGLISLAGGFLDQNRSALVALAYTKADEYGVIEPQALRLVANRSQSQRLLELQGAADTETAWKLFAEADNTTRREEVIIGGGVFGGKTKSAVDESALTRGKVLDQTRRLWEVLVRLKPAALLNGYFVSASPRDPYLTPIPHRGILQLVADFLHCLRGATE
jgi:hypothetical protein